MWGVLKLIKKSSTNIEDGKACRGSSHALHSLSITDSNRKKHQLLTQAGRDIPCTPKQEVQLLYYSSRRKEDFFLAQPMENATAQPMRSCRCSELLLSPNRLSFRTAPPYPPFLSIKTAPLLCLLNLPMVCHSTQIPNCNSFGYSQIN